MERRKKRSMKRRERKRRGSETGREEQHHPVADPSLQPNVPCLVMKMEAKNSHLTSYGPAPLLVFSHGKRERTKTFFNISDGNYNVKNIPEMHRTYCLASCYGWLVMLDKTRGDLFLLNFVSLQKIQLPYLSVCHFSHFVLSSPPTDPDCAIFSIGCSTDFFMYCHPGDDKWIKRKYRIPEEETTIGQVVSCNGKVYIYCLQGEFGIIDVNADPLLTWLEVKEPEWPPTYAVLHYFLVESCGEIFLARWSQLLQELFYILLGNRFRNKKGLHLFYKARLSHMNRSSKKERTRMRRKDEKNEVEQVKKERMLKDLEEMQQENTNLGDMEDIFKITPSKKTEIVEYRPWSDLPIDLLELIALHLFRADFVHLTSSCRSWRSIAPPSLITNQHLSLLTSRGLPFLRNHLPWLMYFGKEDRHV